MNFIIWLIVGAVVGWLATSLMRRRDDTLMNIIIGILGAFLAGLGVAPYFEINTINQNNFSLPAMLVAVGGAVILLAVFHLLRQRGGLRF
ncbi:MAG: GlsB/YeaQ/YmgE family stress response membrane protein [Anaerolineae bacterium]|nr:GlsB/YeaQ/YmgE family stress response membrane protein [Anaerolineae bacterium]